MGEVGKLIDTHLPFLVRISIVFFHSCNILSEKLTSVDKFFFFGDGFVVLLEEGQILTGHGFA